MDQTRDSVVLQQKNSSRRMFIVYDFGPVVLDVGSIFFEEAS